MNSY
jgi:hypothetical protein